MSKEQDILLRKWIQGEITAAEESRLFQMAEKDPFLADALAGFQAKPEAIQAKRIDQLRKELPKPKRSNSAKIIPLALRAAAAVLVVGLVTASIWYWNQPPEVELAQAPAPAQPIEEMNTPDFLKDQSTTAEPLPDLGGPKTMAQANPPEVDQESLIVQEAPPPPVLAENEKPKPMPPVSYDPLPENMEEESKDAEADKLRKESASVVAQEASPRQGRISPSTDQPGGPTNEDRSTSITGKVVDPEGNALIGANVVLFGQDSLSAITDLKGKFLLNVPDTLEVSELLVQYLGYQSLIVRPNAKKELTIQLEPSGTELSEVVISGYSRARKKDRLKSSAPQPKGGFDRLEKYLRKNLIYPTEALQSGIQGEVLLEFALDDRGRPTDIIVLEGLGYGCDEEAIRLLENGPRWIENKHLTSRRLTYSVPFRIQKD